MDDDALRKIAREDPALFFQMYKPPILIDEAQKAPELFNEIKRICDESVTPGLFWLTGSQKFGLVKNVSETLTGRVAILNLYPLSTDEKRRQISASDIPFYSFDELTSFCEKRSSVDIDEVYRDIWEGGYPGSLNLSPRMKKIFYDSYIETYLMRDVIEDSGIRDIYRFRKFLTACASITSNLVNYATLADVAGISQPTAKMWLGVLESLGIVFHLDVYSNSLMKSIIKTPKLYFWDTGLCAYLYGWDNDRVLCNGASSGAFLENYVISEIMKGSLYRGSRQQFFYYRDRRGREIDLVIVRNQSVIPIEIKRTAAPEKKMASSFSLLKVVPPYSLAPGAIMCSEKRVLKLADDLFSVPFSAL